MMSALAQPTRLKVAMALARAYPDGMPVGDIAKLAETPPNTMSSHLAIMSRAGVVTANRLGRVVEYRAVEGAFDALAAFLTGNSPNRR